MKVKQIEGFRTVNGWLIVALAIGGIANAGGKKCVQEGTGTIEVCVEWSDVVAPVLDTDFRVDFSNASNPDIELITGNLGWIVSSEVVATLVPANIGSLSLDPSVSTDDFEVTLQNGRKAGAANVGSLDLTAVGWTGRSSLTGNSV